MKEHQNLVHLEIGLRKAVSSTSESPYIDLTMSWYIYIVPNMELPLACSHSQHVHFYNLYFLYNSILPRSLTTLGLVISALADIVRFSSSLSLYVCTPLTHALLYGYLQALPHPLSSPSSYSLSPPSTPIYYVLLQLYLLFLTLMHLTIHFVVLKLCVYLSTLPPTFYLNL